MEVPLHASRRKQEAIGVSSSHRILPILYVLLPCLPRDFSCIVPSPFASPASLITPVLSGRREHIVFLLALVPRDITSSRHANYSQHWRSDVVKGVARTIFYKHQATKFRFQQNDRKQYENDTSEHRQKQDENNSSEHKREEISAKRGKIRQNKIEKTCLPVGQRPGTIKSYNSTTHLQQSLLPLEAFVVSA